MRGIRCEYAMTIKGLAADRRSKPAVQRKNFKSDLEEETEAMTILYKT